MPLTQPKKNIPFYIHCNNNLETSYPPQILMYKNLALIQNQRANWYYAFLNLISFFLAGNQTQTLGMAKPALTKLPALHRC